MMSDVSACAIAGVAPTPCTTLFIAAEAHKRPYAGAGGAFPVMFGHRMSNDDLCRGNKACHGRNNNYLKAAISFN